ncbi:hypothetical protein GGR51DRAFT_496362, partial [Nemania sp. FL0031]
MTVAYIFVVFFSLHALPTLGITMASCWNLFGFTFCRVSLAGKDPMSHYCCLLPCYIYLYIPRSYTMRILPYFLNGLLQLHLRCGGIGLLS